MTTRVVVRSLSAAMDGGFTAVADVATAMATSGTLLVDAVVDGADRVAKRRSAGVEVDVGPPESESRAASASRRREELEGDAVARPALGIEAGRRWRGSKSSCRPPPCDAHGRSRERKDPIGPRAAETLADRLCALHG